MLTPQSGFEWAPPEVAHLWPRPEHKGAARRNHKALGLSWIGRLPLQGEFVINPL